MKHRQTCFRLAYRIYLELRLFMTRPEIGFPFVCQECRFDSASQSNTKVVLMDFF